MVYSSNLLLKVVVEVGLQKLPVFSMQGYWQKYLVYSRVQKEYSESYFLLIQKPLRGYVKPDLPCQSKLLLFRQYL